MRRHGAWVAGWLVVVGLSACAGGSASPPATAPAVETPAAPAQGAAVGPLEAEERGPAPVPCLGPGDCPGGVCEGEGCGDALPGHCVPAVRACTKDLRTYCGCDGRTFRGSGSCPGRRYAHRGPCEGDSVPASD